MRVIEVLAESVNAVVVSPDGQWFAATGGSSSQQIDRRTGETSHLSGSFRIALVDRLADALIHCQEWSVPILQLAFTPGEASAAFASPDGLFRLETRGTRKPIRVSNERYAGGVAIAPDGRTLVAARIGRWQEVPLDRWELPAWRPVSGFDFWSPFSLLAFSPNGEFLAGIGHGIFELRIAVTGGLNGRQRVPDLGWGILAFSRDSQSVVFGWGAELSVMETRAGKVVQRLPSHGKPFAGTAFLTGSLLATVDGTPVVRLWSTESWEVVREYDWGVGGLTCLTATSDGLTGLCGTESGQVVVFDVDD